MQIKRTLPLLIMLILAGCFRQAEDTFDTVGSQNTGGVVITQDEPAPTETSDVTIIDPNAQSAEDATVTPRVIVAAATDSEDSEPVATNTEVIAPTAVAIIPSDTPQVIPTATEPVIITPEVNVQAAQPTATVAESEIEETLQPTPTAFGATSSSSSDDDCTYVVEEGNNLFRIALNHDVSLAALLAENNLTEASIIHAGDILQIPNCDASGAEADEESPEVIPTAIELDDCDYEIVTGDTLSAIASEYGVTLEALMTENNLTRDSTIFPDDIIRIPNCEDGDTEDDSADDMADDTFEASSVEDDTASGQTIHTVTATDTLISIARLYGVTVNSITQANNIPDPNNLTPGQQLVIPTTEDD